MSLYVQKMYLLRLTLPTVPLNREWSKTDAKAYKKEIFECLNKEFNVKF